MSKGYWWENIRILTILLSIWFIASFLMSIVFVDALDAIEFMGFKFGFWMAQQGSIYIFVILIFVYIKLMDKLDQKYHVSEKELAQNDKSSVDGREDKEGDA